MATTKLPIVEADDEQIRTFAELQGLEIDKAKSRSALLAVLGPAWDHDYILIQKAVERTDDEAAAAAQQTAAVKPERGNLVGGPGANDPVVVVKLTNTESAGGKEPIAVAVNGVTKVVQRNMEVELPYRFYLALENAVREEVDQVEPTQDNPKGDLIVTQIQNYPLHPVRFPPQAEIDAWHARTDDELMPA